jgi:hypothetical protein
LRRFGRIGTLFIAAAMVVAAWPARGVVYGQLPPPGPDPYAVSFGFSAAFPSGALAEQDPDRDTWYAQTGTVMTQRVAVSLFGRLGVYLEGVFPSFGMDAAAVQQDFGSDPPVTEGRVRLHGWGLGIRWRGGAGWLRGPYLEAGGGWWRQEVELRQQGLDPVSESFEWSTGLRAAFGWALPVGRALALDAGLTLSSVTARQEGVGETTGAPFTNRWTDTWIGLRFMAVLTFGGEG